MVARTGLGCITDTLPATAETNDTTFLNFAVNIADMIMERVKTDDAIPYWDYDAPVTEETPRDASGCCCNSRRIH